MKDEVRCTVDALAADYEAQQMVCETANENLGMLRERLMRMVEEHGFTPARAEKSKRLAGVEYQVTVSQSHSVLVRPREAEKLQLACMRAGKPGLFKKLFRRQFVYQVADGATALLAGRLPEGAPRGLRRLFDRAVGIEANTPRLEVRALSPASEPAASIPSGVEGSSRSKSGKGAA